MPRRSNEFQRLIAVIQSHLDPGASIEEFALLEDRVTLTKREVDVCVTGSVAKQAVIVSVECRDRGRPADVTWVDEMNCKHSRLATSLLVLVSHSGFTPEAVRVADAHNIRHVVLTDVAPTSPDRLFPELQSLWGKAWRLEIDRVLIRVEASESLLCETVRVYPDTALYLDNGAALCSAVEMVHSLARNQPFQVELGSIVLPEHKFVEFGWKCPIIETKRVCLQKLDPPMLRAIEQLQVIAKCSVEVSEFPLRHGRYEQFRVAWGTSSLLGNQVMMVATADGENKAKFSVKPIGEGR